jgi:hypothetical protein
MVVVVMDASKVYAFLGLCKHVESSSFEGDVY